MLRQLNKVDKVDATSELENNGNGETDVNHERWQQKLREACYEDSVVYPPRLMTATEQQESGGGP